MTTDFIRDQCEQSVLDISVTPARWPKFLNKRLHDERIARANQRAGNTRALVTLSGDGERKPAPSFSPSGWVRGADPTGETPK